MGLDMYLYRVKPGVKDFKSAIEAERENGWNNCDVLEEVMYWRKAFDIHRWFEEHCKRCLIDDGDPLTQYYPVTKETLVELYDYAKKIIEGGIYVYREGESKRERINLNADTYRITLDEQDVNFDKDSVEARLDSSIADWELEHLFNTFDKLNEVLPTIGGDETLYYYPSY